MIWTGRSPIYKVSSEHVRRRIEVNLMGPLWLVRWRR
jgi:hypothetical protein